MIRSGVVRELSRGRVGIARRDQPRRGQPEALHCVRLASCSLRAPRRRRQPAPDRRERQEVSRSCRRRRRRRRGSVPQARRRRARRPPARRRPARRTAPRARPPSWRGVEPPGQDRVRRDRRRQERGTGRSAARRPSSASRRDPGCVRPQGDRRRSHRGLAERDRLGRRQLGEQQRHQPAGKSDRHLQVASGIGGAVRERRLTRAGQLPQECVREAGHAARPPIVLQVSTASLTAARQGCDQEQDLVGRRAQRNPDARSSESGPAARAAMARIEPRPPA